MTLLLFDWGLADQLRSAADQVLQLNAGQTAARVAAYG